MTLDSYNDHPGLRATVLKATRKSPLHGYHAAHGLSKPTDPMRWGNLIDWCLLDYAEYTRQVRVCQVADRRKSGWKAHVAEYGEEWSITLPESEKLEAMRLAFSVNMDAVQLTEGGSVHEPIYWTDRLLGECKAELDSRLPWGFVELKSCAEIAVARFMSNAERMGYLGQCGWYHHGLEVTTGQQMKCVVISIESKSPYDIVPYDVPRALLLEGYEEMAELARRYRSCELAGAFPGVARGVQTWERPAWTSTGGGIASVDLNGLEDDDE